MPCKFTSILAEKFCKKLSGERYPGSFGFDTIGSPSEGSIVPKNSADYKLKYLDYMRNIIILNYSFGFPRDDRRPVT